MPTEERIAKVKRLLSFRQPDLRVVMEEVTNTHNASAVVRTCEATGILYLEIISASPDPFPVNEAISTRADKWLHFNYHKTTSDCLSGLKKEGFQIVATHLGETAVPYTDIDYTRPTAVVFGNESEGISPEALNLADVCVKIPMFGMVQSLNLSVSVGIILAEAVKQRMAAGFFKSPRLTEEESTNLFNQWLRLAPGSKNNGG